MVKTKIKIGEVNKFCTRLNSTVPYPKNYKENQDYRDAFSSMNTSTPIAIQSHYGIVNINKEGYWDPFPNKTLANVICEKESGKTF